VSSSRRRPCVDIIDVVAAEERVGGGAVDVPAIPIGRRELTKLDLKLTEGLARAAYASSSVRDEIGDGLAVTRHREALTRLDPAHDLHMASLPNAQRR